MPPQPVLWAGVHAQWRQQRLFVYVCVCVYSKLVLEGGGWVAYKHTG